MIKLTSVSLLTTCSLISPSTAILSPNYLGITLGIITPGESIKYIRGLLSILKPFRPLVVHTAGVALAAALLFYRSDMLLI